MPAREIHRCDSLLTRRCAYGLTRIKSAYDTPGELRVHAGQNRELPVGGEGDLEAAVAAGIQRAVRLGNEDGRGVSRLIDRCTNMWCDKEFLNEDLRHVSADGRCSACDQYWRRHHTERPRSLVLEQQQRERASWMAEYREREARDRNEELALAHQCFDCGAEGQKLNTARRCPKCARSFNKTGRQKPFDYAEYQLKNAEVADEYDVREWQNEYGSYGYAEPLNPHDALADEDAFANLPDYEDDDED
jgi:hypothetical protein